MAERRLDAWQEWPLDLVEIVAALERHGVDCVLIGGFAALVRGLPLPTYDLDVMISPRRANRERLLAAMSDLEAVALPDEPEGQDAGSAEQALARNVDVSFFTPCGYLDVVACPAGIRDYADLHRDATRVELGAGVEGTVASLRDVIRSKLAAGRDRDTAKLPALKALAEALHESAP